MKPDYLKALLRRAQSYEATEKLEEALEGDPSTFQSNHTVYTHKGNSVTQITRR